VGGDDLAQMSSDALSLHPGARSASSSSRSSRVDETAAENVALSMMFAGVPRAAPNGRRASCSMRWAFGPSAASPEGASGGEQQRVAIARALANDPQLLLATSRRDLDRSHVGDIMALLKQLNERDGKTIILVTHDAPLAATYAHRTITLSDRTIVGESRS